MNCWKPLLACVLTLAVATCSKGLPTQAESADFDEPPTVAPAVRVEPLEFVEDALVLESLDGLGGTDRAAVLMSQWDVLRTALRGEDRMAAETALRSARGAVKGLASGFEPHAVDEIGVEVLLLALGDAQDALGDDPKP